jgi:hypothetical protein
MNEDQQAARPAPKTNLLAKLGLRGRTGQWLAVGFGALVAAMLLGGVSERSLVLRVLLLLLGVGLVAAWAAPKFSASVPSPLRALASFTRYVWLGAGVLVAGGLFGFMFVAADARRAEEQRQRAELDAQMASAEKKADAEAAADARARYQKAVEAFAANEGKTVEALVAIEKATQSRPSDARSAFDQLEKVFSALDAATSVARKATDKLAAASPDAAPIELPPNVAALKTRFEGVRVALEKRELEVFDALYAALWPPEANPEKWADQMGAIDDSAKMTGPEVQRYRTVVAAVAGNLGLRVDEAKEVFLRVQGSGELDRRLEARKKAIADAAYERCGLPPAGEGIVAVRAYLKRNAHDPDSIDIDECTKPTMTPACWVTTCAWRGKNKRGAKVLQRTRFTIGKNADAEFMGVVVKAEQL